MTLAALRTLAKNLTNDAAADALVDYIAQDGGYGQDDRAFVDKYADRKVRSSVFGGTTATAQGLVMLSPAAGRLKSALQRRNVATFGGPNGAQFAASIAWHITGSLKVARLILAGGFNTADGTVGGYGVYFYNERAKCDNYIPQGGWGNGQGIVLECTIFSRISRPTNAEFAAGYGGDRWANNFTAQIVAVKNPLLIFPRAIYAPAGALA